MVGVTKIGRRNRRIYPRFRDAVSVKVVIARSLFFLITAGPTLSLGARCLIFRRRDRRLDGPVRCSATIIGLLKKRSRPVVSHAKKALITSLALTFITNLANALLAGVGLSAVELTPPLEPMTTG